MVAVKAVKAEAKAPETAGAGAEGGGDERQRQPPRRQQQSQRRRGREEAGTVVAGDGPKSGWRWVVEVVTERVMVEGVREEVVVAQEAGGAAAASMDIA